MNLVLILEVAVAAPYEDDGSGVVYIFRSTEKGLDPVPTQRLVGKEVDSVIKGFGISISKAMDVDGNHYRGIINQLLFKEKFLTAWSLFQLLNEFFKLSDVAIGAYKSSETILYRSKPTVILKHRLKPLKQQIDIEDTNFLVNYCLYYRGLHLPPTISNYERHLFKNFY